MARLEVEVARRVAWRMLGVLAMGLLLFAGWSASPRVEGRPVLLTPVRRSVLDYLHRAEAWAATLSLINGSLSSLMPEPSPAHEDGPLPASQLPAARPDALYDRALAADNAYTHLLALRAQMERVPVPPALAGLHALAQKALADHLPLAEALLDYHGAPTLEKAAALDDLVEAAKGSLTEFSVALEAQSEE